MKPTLLILAAGIASRYGGMKQVDGFGPNGETIMDYSIYDAIRAGFGKVVFIIRENFSLEFKAKFEPKLHGHIARDYVFQTFDLSSYGIKQHVFREKPWGTAHAVLSAKDHIKEPFCVINADDFYGYDAFEKMHHFLTSQVNSSLYALMGYQIGQTLSRYGSVSRGICAENLGYMQEIQERTQVYFKGDDIVYLEEGEEITLPANTRVSMNFWGFAPSIFKQIEPFFIEFVQEYHDNSKAEFLIPMVADALIKSEQVAFKLIPTNAPWFGVTYKEDKPMVQESIRKLINEGFYPERLWLT